MNLIIGEHFKCLPLIVLELRLNKNDLLKVSFTAHITVFLDFFYWFSLCLEKVSITEKNDLFKISSTILYTQFLIYRRVERNSKTTTNNKKIVLNIKNKTNIIIKPIGNLIYSKPKNIYCIYYIDSSHVWRFFFFVIHTKL